MSFPHDNVTLGSLLLRSFCTSQSRAANASDFKLSGRINQKQFLISDWQA